MKTLGIIFSVVIGVLSLIYDLWLVRGGHLHAAAMLGLVAWMALLMMVCARPRGAAGHGAAESGVESRPPKGEVDR